MLEKTSLEQEAEQAIIESCIRYIPDQKRLVTSLPFCKEPKNALKPNRFIAEKVLAAQVKLAKKNPEMVDDINQAHAKLVDNGFVIAESALDAETKKILQLQDKTEYYIPWRTVYKTGSVSTPCRIVFDASSRTPGGESLNGILCKGVNLLSNMFNILLRFRLKPYGLTCDVKMAYNNVNLEPHHYRFQKYLWLDNLDTLNQVTTYIVRTLIYGVKPSGNLTIEGFNILADHAISNYPSFAVGAQALKEDAFMDDIVTGCDSVKDIESISEGIAFTLGLGSMNVKGFTVAGTQPSEAVSNDGESVGLLGYTWYSRCDEIALEKQELFLGKVRRGKRPNPVKGSIKEALRLRFTRRTLLSKAYGVFDPLGLLTPLTAGLKVDLNELVRLKLDWDDQVPDEYLDCWVRNLENIQAAREIRLRRTIVPPDAKDLKIDIIVSCMHGAVKWILFFSAVDC